jgi:hypothetical protein
VSLDDPSHAFSIARLEPDLPVIVSKEVDLAATAVGTASGPTNFNEYREVLSERRTGLRWCLARIVDDG